MVMSNSSNGTNLSNNSLPIQGFQVFDYLKIAAYCLVIIFSLVGNSLVIAVVYKNANQRMRTPSNYFVVSMAVGDGLITAINCSSLPFAGLTGNIGCKIQKFMWFFLVSWSTGSLSAIAVDRFSLVFFPLKRIITLRTARVVIVVIIIIGAAASWPLLIFTSVTEYKGTAFCKVEMPSFGAHRAYYFFMFVTFIFFPLITLLILYTAISIKMWSRKSPGNQEARERRNRKILLMLITIVVLFSLCWLPVSSLYFNCFVRRQGSESCGMIKNKGTRFMLWLVAYSNSAINPYVYFIFNENFRHGARVIWSSIRARCTGPINSHNQVDVAMMMID